jgi:predicted DNA-binding transcriptional regulator AlpA
MNDRLLTPDQLAEKYQVPKSWLYARTRETGPEAIPRLKLGKYLRFPEQKVEEWLNKQNQRD